MKKPSTKTNRESSAASLREIPEVTLKTHRPRGRGLHVEAAKRSLEPVMLDPQTVKLLGGADGVREILNTLASHVGGARKKRTAA